MGIMCGVVSLAMSFKHSPAATWILVVACIFGATAFMLPSVLKPLYISWMKLTSLLGWINTRLILILVFYLVFAPIGLLLRLFRIDILELKPDTQKRSYWKRKEQASFDPVRYGKPF